jgi:hypothetical protein
MGARSKAKQKARATHSSTRGHTHSAPQPIAGPRLASYEVIEKAAAAYHVKDFAGFENALDHLTTESTDVTDASIAENTGHILGELWLRGWQPTDVARVIEHRLGPAHRRWIIDLIALQKDEYPAAKIHDRWTAQLEALGAHVWWDDDSRHMQHWGSRERLDRGSVIRCAAEVVGVLNYLAPLPQLIAPPGQARSGSLLATSGLRAADRRMLDKIRALLAKAESTHFPAEAESYSAKAQELMTRHTVDHALLTALDEDPDKPVGVRVTIDNPYAEAKALLLQVAAEANRCRAVWTSDHGFTTVFGFPSELELTEMLFTRLLVASSAAMVREGSARKGDASARTKGFRQSFLTAYASRIAERLRQAAAQERMDASEHDSRLPVPASREAAREAWMREMAPTSRRSTVRIRDEQGWLSGTAAADRASLRQDG